jgi:hypothetical protein
VISSWPSFAMCCLNRPSVSRAIAPGKFNVAIESKR